MSDSRHGSGSMRALERIDDLREWRCGLAGSFGLVPTMGALHEGHLALVRRARAENDVVAVSIFVNPRQFGPAEDFERYPRSLERDLELLRAESVDAVFMPDASEMYPPDASTEIHVRGVSEQLEGASRPNHFSGVALVVNKLFNMFQPHRAYFGQKDAQQVIVIRKMVADLNMPIDIVPVETVREPDGLAISSRNVYLAPAEREAAGRIAPALFAARDRYQAGERSAEELRQQILSRLRDAALNVEYVSIADAATLQELDEIDRPALILIAAYAGDTRLIDNVPLG